MTYDFRFSTTTVDDAMMRIMPDAALKNIACVEEYPSVRKFQERCVSIIADLWNSPTSDPFGTATTGSSEAVMLGGLAMKSKWQRDNRENPEQRPNVIIGENAHLCVKKFADYFDVEARFIPVSERTNYSMSPEAVRRRIDGGTIGVFLTLGTTYTGHYDPIEQVSNMLDEYERDTGIDVPIHIDAASGGFVAPFTSSNESFVWDFRLPRVKSINASGHKYGQALLAVGWIVWQGLLLESSYLRGTQTAYTLSFSKSSAPIVSQYYQFYQKGLAGYRRLINRYLDIAKLLSLELENTGYFVCLSGSTGRSICREGNHNMNPGIPLVVFTLSEGAKKDYPTLDMSALSDAVHEMKFSIPHYTIKGWGNGGSDAQVMRIVVREDLTLELMQKMMDVIVECVKKLTRE
ncbi:hypothetical protein N7533_013023 [Penicillium manginii]|uniref:uncharacterized protein n=1 Tax=Penicillium manginii TaxID=203109 RepID=UPI0025474C57|nr:uncharacterized protein N7533_013023 [Penicillium manginii]KAJ5734620.1 hypothetical protein N7533_013023 [Penicillium manginii]